MSLFFGDCPFVSPRLGLRRATLDDCDWLRTGRGEADRIGLVAVDGRLQGVVDLERIVACAVVAVGGFVFALHGGGSADRSSEDVSFDDEAHGQGEER